MRFNPQGSQFRLREDSGRERYRVHLHRFLIEELEKRGIDVGDVDRRLLGNHIAGLVDDFISREGIAVNTGERERLIDEMLNEILGYGPLEELFRDPHISDILVNGPERVVVERHGRLEETGVRFVDESHVMRVLQRMLAPTGRRLDESSPMVDARLADGSRLNAIIAPLALDGPDISIRKARRDQLSAGELLANGAFTPEMLSFLRRSVEARMNMLVSGGTGTGKTTLLNLLGQFIDPDQRIITIEDTAELQLDHPHVVSLETRPPNAEGEGEVTARDIVRNVLRMRPDRVVVGEVRGVEVMDLLQAMNTGHDGSMSTLHANNPADALSRLEMLVGFTGYRGSESTLRQMIASALDLLVHVSRTRDGRRRVTSVQELVECRDGNYVLNELFSWDPASGGYRRPASGFLSSKLQRVEGALP
ncbi:CpaF family protein [Guyparkeria sp.]|uniref:CpaF family protein n=1 Tax=Guyparkeria sp. TaxID=2035736 RepID=UPI003970F86C